MLSDSTVLILVSTLVTGLILGSIFSLVAAGVTIVYGCVWLPNTSNGQFFLLAGLLTWSLTQSHGWGILAAAIGVIFISIIFGLILEYVLIRRLYDTPNRNVAYFMVTLGLTQIMSGVFSMTYSKWSDQFSLPPIVEGITMIGPFPLQNNRLFVMVISIFLLISLFTLLRYHPYGRAIRAVFQNREAAALRGVNVKSIYLISFVLGTSIIFLGGILYAFSYSFDLSIAWVMSITAFAIMIIGGPGSVLGALVVGMVFGFTQAIVSIFSSPTVATFSYLAAMLVILLFRPIGLFKR